MQRVARKTKAEPTIALINIVFLMLIFFLVAGTLAQPLDGELKLVQTSDLDGRAPPDALVLHANGRMTYRGDEIADIAAYLARSSEEDLAEIRVVPDRDLPADRLVALSRALRQSGARSVLIVTERALQ